MDSTEERANSAGASALAGFEYQISASIWLALDLIVASKLASECVLEPISQEDLEAELQGTVEEDEPGSVITTSQIGGYRLIVQAKLRTGDAWTASGLRGLLTHGGKVRKSAAELLQQDPSARYLLVTSAGLNSEARHLRVNRAGAWPAAPKLPPSLAETFGVSLGGRLAVIRGKEPEDLEGEIKTLLTENFHVPNARYAECRLALREAARAKVLGAGAGRWTRAELEIVIREHEGYLASSPDLESYVYPTNWNELLRAVEERYAVLILGQSGTGKTQTSHKLQDELGKRLRGLKRIAITRRHAPGQVVKDQTVPPVVFDIEDPWGRYEFDRDSRDWNDQLADIMRGARHDRIVIATSRRDVATEAGALAKVSPWIVDLESEHYDLSRRRALYHNRLDTLPPTLQVAANENESLVLNELSTPLEIQKFFDELRITDPNKPVHVYLLIRDAIKRAHQNSIESTVKEQIEAHAAVPAAAVVWGLLKSRDRLALDDVRRVEEVLDVLDHDAFREGVTPLINFFIAARNLRQPPNEASVSYYHPRVESGIEQTLSVHRMPAKRSLRFLVEALLSVEGDDPDWGMSTAVRMIESIARRRPDLKPTVSAGDQVKIDAWLETRVMTLESDLDANLKLAAAAGSKTSVASEFARFMQHRPDTSFPGLHRWGPPPHDATWYAWMRANPVTQLLLSTYIRTVLPHERADFHHARLLDELSRLAADLTPAFLDAAKIAVWFGVNDVSSVIAEGALQDLDGFESVVDMAVQVVTPTPENSFEAARVRLRIENGEVGGDFVEEWETSDDGHTAREYLGAYVDQIRSIRQWGDLLRHRHRDKLLYYWVRSLYHASPSQATDDEVAAVFDAGYSTAEEIHVWPLVKGHWQKSFLPRLRARVMDGQALRSVQLEALRTLIERVPDELNEIALTLQQRGGRSRLLEIAFEIADLRLERATDILPGAAQHLPTPYAQISDAFFRAKDDQSPDLSEEAWDLLKQNVQDGQLLRWFRIRLDRHRALPVDEDIRWLLAHGTDVDKTVDALEGAIRHGLSADIEAALEHRFSRVVASALTAIGTPLPAPLPTRLLQLGSAKPAPVRQALIALLDAKPHLSNQTVLLSLVSDTWSNDRRYENQSAHYPIARAAAAAINKLETVDQETAEKLYRVAINSPDAPLRFQLFQLLAQKGDTPAQTQLFTLATTPGRESIKCAAAHALLVAYESIEQDIPSRITAELLIREPASVSLRFTFLLAAAGENEAVLQTARELMKDRRALVLLVPMLWVMSERDSSAAELIAHLLPPNHVGVAWARTIPHIPIEPGVLDDLGDPIRVHAVQEWFEPPQKPAPPAPPIPLSA